MKKIVMLLAPMLFFLLLCTPGVLASDTEPPEIVAEEVVETIDVTAEEVEEIVDVVEITEEVVKPCSVDEGYVYVDVYPDNAFTVTGEGFYKAGETVTLSLELNEGYVFLYWADASLEYITDDITYTFVSNGQDYVFCPVVVEGELGGKLNVVVEGNGEVEIERPEIYFPYPITNKTNLLVGEKLYLKTTPIDGSRFDGWYCDGSCISKNLTYIYTVSTQDQEFVAKFVEDIVTINIAIEGEGACTGAGEYPAGEIVTLTAEPAAENIVFEGWYTENGRISSDPVFEFTAEKSMSFTAKFTTYYTYEIEYPEEICIGQRAEINVWINTPEGRFNAAIWPGFFDPYAPFAAIENLTPEVLSKRYDADNFVTGIAEGIGILEVDLHFCNVGKDTETISIRVVEGNEIPFSYTVTAPATPEDALMLTFETPVDVFNESYNYLKCDIVALNYIDLDITADENTIQIRPKNNVTWQNYAPWPSGNIVVMLDFSDSIVPSHGSWLNAPTLHEKVEFFIADTELEILEATPTGEIDIKPGDVFGSEPEDSGGFGAWAYPIGVGVLFNQPVVVADDAAINIYADGELLGTMELASILGVQYEIYTEPYSPFAFGRILENTVIKLELPAGTVQTLNGEPNKAYEWEFLANPYTAPVITPVPDVIVTPPTAAELNQYEEKYETVVEAAGNPFITKPVLCGDLIVTGGSTLTAIDHDTGVIQWQKPGLFGVPIVKNNIIYVLKYENNPQYYTESRRGEAPTQVLKGYMDETYFCIIASDGTVLQKKLIPRKTSLPNSTWDIYTGDNSQDMILSNGVFIIPVEISGVSAGLLGLLPAPEATGVFILNDLAEIVDFKGESEVDVAIDDWNKTIATNSTLSDFEQLSPGFFDQKLGALKGSLVGACSGSLIVSGKVWPAGNTFVRMFDLKAPAKPKDPPSNPPKEPEEPKNPSEPEKPSEPEQPEEPEEPEQPEEPEEPEQPEEPQPEEPKEPIDEPEEPITDKPDKPAIPNKPEQEIKIIEPQPVEEPTLGTVEGVIKMRNGRPLANTRIELHSDPTATVTDQNGYFKFDNVPLGQHKLYIADLSVANEKILLTSIEVNKRDKTSIIPIQSSRIEATEIFLSEQEPNETIEMIVDYEIPVESEEKSEFPWWVLLIFLLLLFLILRRRRKEEEEEN